MEQVLTGTTDFKNKLEIGGFKAKKRTLDKFLGIDCGKSLRIHHKKAWEQTVNKVLEQTVI
jgi:hypothetical protein